MSTLKKKKFDTIFKHKKNSKEKGSNRHFASMGTNGLYWIENALRSHCQPRLESIVSWLWKEIREVSISRYDMKMKTYNKFKIRSTHSYDTVRDSIFTFRTIKFRLRKNIITVWTWITCFLFFCPIWLSIRNERCSQNSKGEIHSGKKQFNFTQLGLYIRFKFINLFEISGGNGKSA